MIKIKNHGSNLEVRLFTCSVCFCEFYADRKEYKTEPGIGHYMYCPECGFYAYGSKQTVDEVILYPTANDLPKDMSK